MKTLPVPFILCPNQICYFIFLPLEQTYHWPVVSEVVVTPTDWGINLRVKFLQWFSLKNYKMEVIGEEVIEGPIVPGTRSQKYALDVKILLCLFFSSMKVRLILYFSLMIIVLKTQA